MIIGLSGYAGSGKDTVGAYLVEHHGFTRLAFADALKEMAYRLNPIVGLSIVKNYDKIVEAPETNRLKEWVDNYGWDTVKTQPEVRRILQVLGTECCREIIGPNIWVSVLVRNLTSNANWQNKNWVITDVRFANELDWVKELGRAWWVDSGIPPLNAHISENAIAAQHADTIIDNKGTLSELYSQVDKLIGAELA